MPARRGGGPLLGTSTAARGFAERDPGTCQSRRALPLGAFMAVVFLLAGSRAEAHGMRTAYLELTEALPGRATAHLRLNAPDPTIGIAPDPACRIEPAGDAPSVFARSWIVECPGGFRGHTATVIGLGPVFSEAVVWGAFLDGTTTSRIVRATDPTFSLQKEFSHWQVAREYLRLGVWHILTGYDHLLFLLLLVLLLRRLRSVLLAETAFTLSHSLSFSATALGWIHLSPAGAEACIALSLVLLAADIDLRGAPAGAWQGARMAFVFGLVHGLGFAGGLREIGLPERAIAPALVSFCAGVELGQVAFLLVVLGGLHLARDNHMLPRLRWVGVYAAGSVSAFWFIERTVGFWTNRL